MCSVHVLHLKAMKFCPLFQTLQLKSFYFPFWWPCRQWHWHWKWHVNHISWDIFAIFRWWCDCPVQSKSNKKVEHSDDPATKRLIRLMEAQCHYQADSQPTPEQWEIIFLYLLKNFLNPDASAMLLLHKNLHRVYSRFFSKFHKKN